MGATLACIAGEEVYRQWNAGGAQGAALGRRPTPFGPSGEVFRAKSDEGGYYFLVRCSAGRDQPVPHRVNDRANLYALKDLGANCILGWGPGAAITHNIALGELVVLSDLIDQTSRRDVTFFEGCPLGALRQFPVFCGELRRMIAEILDEMKFAYYPSGVAAVREGPRHETPAEVRMLATLGAEIVTHTFVPEMFLARELQMGYAAVCYIQSYAETGSLHRPFAGGLFKELAQESQPDQPAGAIGAMSRIAASLARRLADVGMTQCAPCRSQADHIRQYNLPKDWRKWFKSE
jgi:5'-methylthioadenosine phosphorylase